MYKVDITYQGYDKQQHSETLYFHLTKAKLAKNLWIRDEVVNLRNMLGDEPRELTTEEVAQILDLVEKIMDLSYGKRSADGKEFDDNPEVQAAFKRSAAHDELLYQLFSVEGKAMEFIVGVIPEDLVMEAQAEANQAQLPIENKELPSPESEKKEKDPRDMTREELMEAYKAKVLGQS